MAEKSNIKFHTPSLCKRCKDKALDFALKYVTGEDVEITNIDCQYCKDITSLNVMDSALK